MPIMIRDKSYTMVHERLQLVHESGKTFEIVTSEPLACGDRWVWRVTVKIDERQFIGSAEVHLNAKPGSADATDPIACAETSAIGRAVGMAGFGSAESIATADEIVAHLCAQSRQNGQHDAQKSAPASSDLSPKIKALADRAKEQGIDTNERWSAMLRYLDIGKIKSEAEIVLIESYLTQEAEKRAGTTF